MPKPTLNALNHPANGGIKFYKTNGANVSQFYLPLCDKAVYNEEVEVVRILLCNPYSHM
ncbi:TPA: hypothetical protein JAN39_004776 [Salmonella enterica subsp. enterica serovar Dublin]|nr:hypothetical protein [Salmonella enterica subsp. enterica serovar Dublin]